MTPMDEQTAALLRQGFKYMNRFILLLWRLGLGKWINMAPKTGGQIMVITHTGRKSGLQRHTPVNYALVDDDIYCTAGFGHGSDWYRNMLAKPEIEIWLPDSWWEAAAEDVSDHEQRIPLLRQVIIASGFAGQLAGLDPHTMSDEEFATATAEYRLIRIRRTAPRTGPGGPGELAWIWPLLAFILLPLLLLRRKE